MTVTAADRPALLPKARQLWQVAPHAGAHHPALRMALSAMGPLLVLAVAGHAQLSGWALLGTVAGAYGRADPARRRLRVQATVGAFLVTLAVAATALVAAATPGLVLVGCTALVAGIATTAADRNHWSPAGALFAVFVFGAGTAIPATAADLPVAAGLAAAGWAWTLLITATTDALRGAAARRRGAVPVDPPPSPQPPWRLTLLHAAVCVVAASLAGGIALLAGLQHPAWAMVAAVVPVVGTATSGQLLRAGHRLVGTLAGVLAAGALFWQHPGPLSTALLFGGLFFGAELLIARNYALALLFVTPLTIGLAGPDTPQRLLELMADRALENTIGVIVAVLLVLASHRLRADAARPMPPPS